MLGQNVSGLRDYHFGVDGIMSVWVLETFVFLSCEYMFEVGLNLLL